MFEGRQRFVHPGLAFVLDDGKTAQQICMRYNAMGVGKIALPLSNS